MRPVSYIIAFLVVSFASTAQSREWAVTDGKARMQAVISVPGKDASYLYKQVNWWLIASFKNPEEIIKARVEAEYLRGERYHANLHQFGAVTAADLKYTFTIEFRDEKVRLTLSNGVVVYDDPIVANRVRPIEYYLEDTPKKKKDRQIQGLVASINNMSANLLESLESFLLTEYVSRDDW